MSSTSNCFKHELSTTDPKLWEWELDVESPVGVATSGRYYKCEGKHKFLLIPIPKSHPRPVGMGGLGLESVRVRLLEHDEHRAPARNGITIILISFNTAVLTNGIGMRLDIPFGEQISS